MSRRLPAPGPVRRLLLEVRMTSTSSMGSGLPRAAAASRTTRPGPSWAQSSQTATWLLARRGLVTTLVGIAVGILVVVGGGGRANAFNLLPREDRRARTELGATGAEGAAVAATGVQRSTGVDVGDG